jgi:PAS domain S-box-containing protein
MAKYSYEQLLKKYQKTKKELLDFKNLRQIISEKEEILRTIAERSFAGIYIVQNGIFRFVNESAAAYAGYSQDELIGLKSDSIVFLEDVEVVKKNARAMLRGERSKPHEFRIVSKGGDIRWVMETVSSITYDNERAILGNSMNITEIKVAEERLKESEQQLSDIIEFLPDATFAIDRTGKVIAWNRAIESITGVKAIDIVGKGDHEYALPFYRTRRPILIDLVFKSNEKIEKKYNYIRREEDVLTAEASVQLQGKERVLWGKANPLRNSSGYIIGAIESMRDITERKQIEEALRESERRLSDIIEFLPDATFAIDRTGKVIAWNRAIESITGVKAKDMMGKGNYEYAIPFYGERKPLFLDLVFKRDKNLEQSYSNLQRLDNILIAEKEISDFRGERVFLWGKAGPLYDDKGNIIGAIETIRDITEQKQIENSLRTREQELEVKNVQLEDLNATLRVLLKQRENDRNDLEETVLANVKKLIVPFLEKINREPINAKTRAYLETLDSNLRDIISPFAHKISSKYVNLTNREVQIAGLIKDGRSTKEISGMLNLSESSINIHRYNMRKKLGLSKKHNLHAYLSIHA